MSQYCQTNPNTQLQNSYECMRSIILRKAMRLSLQYNHKIFITIKENETSPSIVYCSELDPIKFVESELNSLDRDSILTNENYKDVLLDEYKHYSHNKFSDAYNSTDKSTIKKFITKSEKKCFNFEDLEDGIKILQDIKSKIEEGAKNVILQQMMNNVSYKVREDDKNQRNINNNELNLIKAINKIIPNDEVPGNVFSSLNLKFKDMANMKGDEVKSTVIDSQNNEYNLEKFDLQFVNFHDNKEQHDDKKIPSLRKELIPHIKGVKARKNSYPNRAKNQTKKDETSFIKEDKNNQVNKIESNINKEMLTRKNRITSTQAKSALVINNQIYSPINQNYNQNKPITNAPSTEKKFKSIHKNIDKESIKIINNNRNNHRKLDEMTISHQIKSAKIKATNLPEVHHNQNRFTFDEKNIFSNLSFKDFINMKRSRMNSADTIGIIEDGKISMPQSPCFMNNNHIVYRSPLGSPTKLTQDNPSRIQNNKLDNSHKMNQIQPNFMNALNFFNNANSDSQNSFNFIDSQYSFKMQDNSMNNLFNNNNTASLIPPWPSNVNTEGISNNLNHQSCIEVNSSNIKDNK